MYLNIFFKIAKLCCCQPCFMNWLYLEDNTKCSTCGILLKNILTREQADKFCERINLKWKRLSKNYVISIMVLIRFSSFLQDFIRVN